MFSLFILLGKNEEAVSSTLCQRQVPNGDGKANAPIPRAPEHASLGELQLREAERGRISKDRAKTEPGMLLEKQRSRQE